MEKTQALEQLRAVLRPGDTLATVARHISRSGGSRSFSVFVILDGALVDLDYQASRVLSESIDRRHGGIRTHSGGDGGRELVERIAFALWADGTKLQHKEI